MPRGFDTPLAAASNLAKTPLNLPSSSHNAYDTGFGVVRMKLPPGFKARYTLAKTSAGLWTCSITSMEMTASTESFRSGRCSSEPLTPVTASNWLRSSPLSMMTSERSIRS